MMLAILEAPTVDPSPNMGTEKSPTTTVSLSLIASKSGSLLSSSSLFGCGFQVWAPVSYLVCSGYARIRIGAHTKGPWYCRDSVTE